MVHRDEDVLARVRGERLAQTLQPRGAEAAGVLAGEERAEQHDRPRTLPQLAAELERPLVRISPMSFGSSWLPGIEYTGTPSGSSAARKRSYPARLSSCTMSPVARIASTGQRGSRCACSSTARNVAYVVTPRMRLSAAACRCVSLICRTLSARSLRESCRERAARLKNCEGIR